MFDGKHLNCFTCPSYRNATPTHLLELAKMSPKFRRSILSHANYAMEAMMSCSNEQSVKSYLIEPFLVLLGYDTREPGVVVPEVIIKDENGSFGRVDYVIKTETDHFIAIECKALGSKLRDEQGQLRRYFDDIDRVLVGILTNGMVYHLFTNVDMRHRMDAEPFATIDIKAISENGVSDGARNLLHSLSRGNFDKTAIEELARTKLIEKRLKNWWFNQMKHPSEELCRLALKEQGVNRVTKKMIQSLRPMITKGFLTALGQDICERISEKGGLEEFRTSSKQKIEEDPRIITTEREVEIFNYCKTKLAHHANSVVPFALIQQIDKKDYVTKFCIFFKQVNNGRILDYYELEDGEKFEFPNGAVYYDINEIDDVLVETFLQRIREYGEA